MEINYSSFSVNHDWLSKACWFTDGHATRIHEVYLLTVVIRRLNSLSVLKRIVAQIHDQIVDELLRIVYVVGLRILCGVYLVDSRKVASSCG